MTDWMTIRVVLIGTPAAPLAAPPGRVMLAHADHTFADFADAIDVAFARWDLTHRHRFDVEGRTVILGGDEEDPEAEDSEEVALGEVGLRPGSRFPYVFDLGDRWTHDCLVEDIGVDPFEEFGEEPEVPVPIFGWGTIPDQYGRLGPDDPPEELEDLGPLFDEELEESLASWSQLYASSWRVVADALEGIERPRPDDELATAVADLKDREDNDDWPYDVLWAAGGLDDGDLPSDDEELWLELGAGTVSPRDALPLDPETEAAWAALEPADWAGAVIELVRGGVGQPADPSTLVELIRDCPEIEGDPLTVEDEAVVLEGFQTVVELWVALGALDDRRRLTALGRWGLPEALQRAWSGL